MRVSSAKPLAFAFVLVTLMGLLLSAALPSVHASTVIAFDAAANWSCGDCGATTSWSHTVGSGSNPILIVGVSGPNKVVSTVTYGGTPLTPIAAKSDPPNNVRAEMWYLLNPPSGMATIQVTLTSSPVLDFVGGSVSYFNVAGVGNSNSANGADSGPASVTVNANSGDLVVDTLVLVSNPYRQTISAGAGQTPRWRGGIVSTLIGAGSDKPASSPVTMTWSASSGSVNWAIVAVDLQPVAIPPPPPPASTTINCGFMLSVAPYSQTVVQGGTAVFGLSMSLSNPSCAGSSVNLNNMDVTGLGPGMDWQVTPSGDSIAITTGPMTPPGPYALSLIFSVNGVQQQVGFTLIVNPATSASTTVVSTTTPVPTTQAFSYSVTVSPSSQSVQIGGSTSYVVSVIPVAGSPVPVSLTVMGLPGDVRSSFTTQSGVPPYTSTLNLDLSTSTASPGGYTLTVMGTTAGNVQSATATLMIQPAQTTTTPTPPLPPPNDDTGGLIIIVALVALAVVLGVLAMRGRGRRKATQQVSAPRTFCGKCGTENSLSNQFCVSCGNKLKSS